MSEKALISSEGAALLADRVMHEALSAIASAVGVSAEEYLERLEAVLLERPEEIFNAFGECK
ncbi:MAG: hypothetical protein IJW66_03945 [Clostridia bacterium]|nr:hypothetical protein [Clostridia bacterium]